MWFLWISAQIAKLGGQIVLAAPLAFALHVVWNWMMLKMWMKTKKINCILKQELEKNWVEN
ncbi:hypothetical protein [Bacillus bombysepticus]|uniref:hypothetical protein n=1 Tax=Bacillus bombysepticus TaxID=658666 RepID=UPI0030175F32